MMNDIDYTAMGLTKAQVLCRLYNASAPMGMGLFQAEPGHMTEDEAQKLIDEALENRWGLYFDYVKGRPLKVDLERATFDPFLFERDNGGPGAARRALNECTGRLATGER